MKSFFRKLVLPHEINSFRPHLFRHHALYSIALLISQLSFGITMYAPLAANVDALEVDVFKEINQERARESLPALKDSIELNKAANTKLKDMFAKDYWDHTSPDGTKAWVFIKEAGYEYEMAGENLAKGFTGAKGMVSAWMRSPSHRENILSPSYEETGIAVGNGTIDGKKVTLAVQLFGTKNPNKATPLVAGQQSTVPEINLQAPIQENRLPFFVVYLGIFALVIFDGFMLRRNGLHHNKKHILSFRLSLALNIIVLAFLTLNFASVV